MSDKTEEAGQSGDGAAPVTAEDVMRMIREHAPARPAGSSAPASAGRRASATDHAEDVASQVAAEVARIRDQEKADGERKALADQVAKLTEQVTAGAKATVKAPRTFRKITLAMWGGGDGDQ